MAADLSALSGMRFFKDIEAAECGAMLTCLHAFERRYSRGEYVLLDQDAVENVGLLLSGMVHMLKEDSHGHKIMLAYLEPGDILGETFALKPEKNSYVSYYAARDAQILFLSLKHIREPCRKNCSFHGRLVQNLLQMIGERNQQLIERIEVAAKVSLRDKILSYLSILADKQGQKYITIPLNRTEMASYLQSNRSAMSRELMAMKADGLIDYDGRTFLLKN
ncbi:MAG: Crp/Fnr family transcriptional regulator [Oscillospiraceae bacterium]|nr:Crp/Fnr family transcriptional regulator [Oscillospiraceae bacterium]